MLNKLKFFLLSIVTVFALAACEKVPAGHVGIKVNLLGSAKGVEIEELGVGRYWIGINEELYKFPTFTQNYTWTDEESIGFQTTEGMKVSADVGISYAIDPEKVPMIFQKYRRGIDEITDIYIRNMVRDALVTQVSTKSIRSVYGSGKADIIAAVEEQVRAQVEPIGIMIERIYWAGELVLPEAVVTSLNDKIGATQRAEQRENEIREKEAEAQKQIATARGNAESILIEAEAQAKANRIIAESLTPELIQSQAIATWDGVLPKMTGDGAVPFIDVTKNVE
jgi:regulator of protease activity HflC (stomatin/prohibitin superfamily)